VSETGEPRPTLACAKCKQALVSAPVAASYLGNRFPIELLKCPGCGKVFVPEGLATGKIAQVEQLLEDK
jgi:flavoprotein